MAPVLTASTGVATRTDRLRRVLAVAFCAAVLACAPPPQNGATPASRRALLGEEIQAASVTTAYDAVARLRPEWLRRRGQISFRDPDAGDVVVYLNGMRYGGIGALAGIGAESVVQMEFVNGPVATMRYGTGHGGGAILVRTR
jgi:hypothetical protein